MIFFGIRKNIFSGFRKYFGYSFDVKISDLSIYDVFRAFGAWQILFPAHSGYCGGTKTCPISVRFRSGANPAPLGGFGTEPRNGIRTWSRRTAKPHRGYIPAVFIMGDDDFPGSRPDGSDHLTPALLFFGA